MARYDHCVARMGRYRTLKAAAPTTSEKIREIRAIRLPTRLCAAQYLLQGSAPLTIWSRVHVAPATSEVSPAATSAIAASMFAPDCVKTEFQSSLLYSR